MWIVILAYIGYDTQASWKIIVPIFVGLLSVTVLFELLDKRFDGWTLEKDAIVLKRKTLIGKLVTKTLQYKEIDDILYCESAGRFPQIIWFKTMQGKFKLMPYTDIFHLAMTLKYFKSQGITVRLSQKDCEIEFFIEGKIDSLPMTNNMKING
jgi:hypothetical protein